MAASEAAVTAVMETLGCERYNFDGVAFRDGRCRVHRSAFFTDRGCPVAVAAADAAVDADRASIQAETIENLGLTWETKAHERTGPGKCSCGFDAYRNAGIMADYTALTLAHFRAVERGKVPTGRRLVGPWTDAQP